MSREDPHFRLRIPADLKAEIEASAKTNARSMMAEIVARLSGAQANLRDQFAMAALTGVMANPETSADMRRSDRSAPQNREFIAKVCFQLADAMLAAREGGA